jgi:hypothetical protein
VLTPIRLPELPLSGSVQAKISKNVTGQKMEVIECAALGRIFV